jgi:hypothetical protein
MSKPLDEALSKELAKRIKSKADDSFNNAYKAVLLTEGAKYVQGFLAFAGKPYKPLEHSWIELEDRIIDPSFPHLDKKLEELHYFPVQRLSVKQLKAAVEEAKEDYPDDDPLPIYGEAPYEYYGDVMLGGSDYQAAYLEAEAKSKELNQPKKGS